MNCRTY